MRSYKIKLPRNVEVDIFDLPKDFEEIVIQTFQEYTAETSEEYMYCDKLGYIDCFINHLNHDKRSDDAVGEMVGKMMLSEWRENGEIIREEDVYCPEFMAECYVRGQQSARLYSHFGTDDHHIYDQIQQVLVQVITIVMNYEG